MIQFLIFISGGRVIGIGLGTTVDTSFLNKCSGGSQNVHVFEQSADMVSGKLDDTVTEAIVAPITGMCLKAI